MDAGKRSVNDIFNGNKILVVPFFQRSYIWGTDQWERFLEDAEAICSSRQPYFMGSLILKQQMTGSDDAVGNVRLVIDGQQRLTTISILLKVLSLKTGAIKKFEKRFQLDDDRPVLQHNRNDEKSYNAIMELDNLADVPGNSKVVEAYNYFRENADPEKLDFDMLCNLILFVGIDLGYDEDEQQIFDTINSLGVKLTTAELLKNYFFGRDDIKLYDEYWRPLFEENEEARDYWDQDITTGRIHRTFIDLFFYSFLQIKIQDAKYSVTAEDKVRFNKVERLFESYKAFIKLYAQNDKKGILQDIYDYAIVFKRIISKDILQQEAPSESCVERINILIFTLDTTTLIPYILFVEKNVVDEEEKNHIYNLLESYIMRRVITRQTTKNYNRLFSESLLLNQVLSKDALASTFTNIDDTLNRMPSDEEVIKGFHDSELTNKYATTVLYMIESKIRNKDMHATGLLGVKQYSLEHLMPKKWINKWPHPDDPVDVERRNHILLTLGNLAIIRQSLNASIRDADWITKKEGSGNRGGLIKYGDGIETLSNYLTQDVWDEYSIYSRAGDLAKLANSIWCKE